MLKKLISILKDYVPMNMVRYPLEACCSFLVIFTLLFFVSNLGLEILGNPDFDLCLFHIIDFVKSMFSGFSFSSSFFGLVYDLIFVFVITVLFFSWV